MGSTWNIRTVRQVVAPVTPAILTVAVKECAPEHPRECGCQRGYYKDHDHSASPEDFDCRPCTECVNSNRQTKKNCSEDLNTVCGDCLPNFHLQGDECRPAPSFATTADSAVPLIPEELTVKGPGRNNTKKGEEPRDFRYTAYFLFCLPCLFLLGAGITYCKRRRMSGESSPVGRHTIVNSACVDTLLAAAGVGPSPKHKSEEPAKIPLPASPPRDQRGLLRAGPSPQCSPLQGRKLYAVIDAVPARRWKEFMRGLGLRDGEIEAVEVEYTQLREQQYEMLKRWRQQQGATVDAIFAVLEDMHLGGCAQELREQLQPSTLPPTL